MTEHRLQRITEVASRRQPDLTVVLENVHDPHNIGAVLRTCDSVGIREIFVLHHEPQLAAEKLVIGKRTASGARKWVDVHYFTDPAACFKMVRYKYGAIFGTHLTKESSSLYELDLSEPAALVFGNEHDGISPTVLPYLDANFIIPQMGMVKSLNISVACAVSLYEALRQRLEKGLYENPRLTQVQQQALTEDYIHRHESKFKGRSHRVKE